MSVAPTDSAVLLHDFVERAKGLGADVFVTTIAELPLVLGTVTAGSRSDAVQVAADLASMIPDVARDAASGGWPEVMISRARAAVAATGSLVVVETRRTDRLDALLCTRHIVLLPGGALLSTLEDVPEVLRAVDESGDGRYWTLVSGPSRTSDIERVLTIGVHGPRELVVVVITDWQPDAA